MLERTVPGRKAVEAPNGSMGPRCQWPSHGPCAGLSRGLPGRQEVGLIYHFSPSCCLATLNWGTPGDGGSVAKQRAGAGSLRPLWAGHANCRRLAPLRCERILPPWVCPCYRQPSAIPEVPTWAPVPRAGSPPGPPALPSSCFSRQTP